MRVNMGGLGIGRGSVGAEAREGGRGGQAEMDQRNMKLRR